MKTSLPNNEQTCDLAARMDLPLPFEFYSQWAKRAKIFDWCREGLAKHDINGHACIYPRHFAAFVSSKFNLKQRGSALVPPGSCMATCDLPLRLECYSPWAGRSQLRAWRADGLTIETINGHPCIHPDEFGPFVREKFHLPPFGA